MPTPLDKELYLRVKKLATKKFKSPSGVYRSSWIVREYKSRGGKYKGSKSSRSGIKRWFREKWIDLNSPIRSKSKKIIGYKSCGRSKSGSVKGKYSRKKYPLCRPSKKISSKTPRTYKSISKKAIRSAKRYKSRYRSRGKVSFKK